ncbi:MAG: response regulator [Anaerolineae bacterium]|jgi:two-component system cell cycle response regulator DivK|nr:response regulator [Anaerolineae bacterium]
MSKILVVEDSPMIQEILVERLRFRNYEVIVAQDGQEGVEMAQREQPDLILMDISLPVMDGWEATEHIRKIESIKNIPIIALTAHALVEDRNRSLAIGCNDFETKPINFSQLILKINALLGTSQN